MGSNIYLILGLLAFLVALTTAAENADTRLSEAEEAASLRVARFAEAGGKRRARRRKIRKENKKAKKELKLKKRRNRKNNNISKSSKKHMKIRRNRRKRKNKNRRRGKKGKPSKNKRKIKNRKNLKGSRKSSRTIDGKCLESAMTVMRRWKDVVANFEKQKTRIEKQATIAGKKSDKKAVFAPIALKLVDLGGGNKSALTCSGSADSDGAKQLTNLTNTLFDCEVAVNASCTTDFPMPNMTFVDACANATANFVTMATDCMTKSKEATAGEACTCWASEDMAAASEAVKDCKIAEVSAIAQGLKACKEAFSKCRKYEDEAVTSMAACAVSAAQLKEKAAALSANKNAMDGSKTKVAEMTASTRNQRRPTFSRHRGAGSLSASSRAAATSCSEFIQFVQICEYPQINKLFGTLDTVYFQWSRLLWTFHPVR